jgi:hypothetical protein
LLKEIIADYADENYDYETDTIAPHARRADFEMVEVIPVSDPNAATMSQRLVQYQAVIQLSQTAPQIYDMPKLHRGMLEVLGIKNADKLVPLPEDQKPRDPVTENMNIINGKPVKAFNYQDHEAHIQVHMSAMQDPMIAQLIGQNPKANQIMAAAQAHIAEHVAFAYKQKIEQQMGVMLPKEDEDIPESIEKQLSAAMPQAAAAVLGQSQQMVQQQQAQQQAQDPVLQMRMEELALKRQEMALEQQRLQIDAATKADRQRLDEQRLQIEAAEKADKIRLDEKRLQVDAARYADQNAIQARRASQPPQRKTGD